MKILIITANPSSKGFTHKIVDEIKKIKKNSNDVIDIIDLYKTNLKQDFLKYEDKKEIKKENITNSVTLEIQEKISWADELIFIFPIWWGDMPAIMKNFFESNFGPGFGFKYEKKGTEYKKVGLIKGKTYRIIVTTGENALIYKLLVPIRLIWKLNRTGFCGIKEKSFTIFGNMDRRKTNKEKYLNKLKTIFK